jgi:hypothetical protein
MLVEDVASSLDVRRVVHGLLDVEVVPPAGDLQSVVAPVRRKPADLHEGQVRELAGEEGDGTWHVHAFLG